MFITYLLINNDINIHNMNYRLKNKSIYKMSIKLVLTEISDNIDLLGVTAKC